ncbi:MAG: UDP-N-acetylmuramoyl-tripeptide--D-alanyl-D-alanine ligase [Ginsengibacter sp.]
MTIAELYTIFCEYPTVKTDTRQIEKDDIFFALKGPNFNGNAFIDQALEEGAAYVVTDEAEENLDNHIIKFDDVLIALQQLARHHRSQFNIPVLAITGSNGKTTTKELIHAVLSSTYNTYTTKGNFNNHIGIPLTLLSIKKDAEIAVVEMGANNPGEIASYCKYVNPTHGLITNFGKAHLEGFGSLEGVRNAKSELFNYLLIHDGTAFINTDDPYLIQKAAGIKSIITYGSQHADITGKAAGSTSELQIDASGRVDLKNIRLQLVGDYNLPNVLAAVAVGNYFKITPENIKTALQNYQPSNSRSQLLKQGSNTIILDAYNANPSSMQAAITNFAKMPGDQKILMLGGMMELGIDSALEHRQLVDLINSHQWQKVLLVGKQFKGLADQHLYFDKVEEARTWLAANPVLNATILIKGSRSMQMEKMIDKL